MKHGVLVTEAALSADLRRFVADAQWTFAKTMPAWPHEYLVRGRVDARLFDSLVTHIRSHGYEGRFYRRTITYFEEDGLVYWTKTTIINRCKVADTYEARAKPCRCKNSGRLKRCTRRRWPPLTPRRSTAYSRQRMIAALGVDCPGR